MEEAIELLEKVESLLAKLSAADFARFSDEALIGIAAQAERVGRRVGAISVFTAAQLAVRSRPELGDAGLSRRLGHQRTAHLIEQVTLVSASEAGRRIRLGAAVAPRASLDGHRLDALFPRVAAALADGDIGVEAGLNIVKALDQASSNSAPNDLAAAEAALVRAAATRCADLIADQARAWRDHLDTDGAAPRDDQQRAKRRFTLGRERDDGMTPFSGLADPVSAGILRAAFGAFRSKPRFVEEGWDENVTPESRTFEQRDFDILMGVIVAGIRADETFTPGGRATVVATVSLEDLQKGVGVGWLDDVRESVSIETIDELVCDSGLEIAITAANGALLALTSRRDFFTRQQRRALAARDGGCVWPACHAPASWADAHHVIERQHGGPTEVSNGVLLCPAHHHMLHSSDYTMKMIRGRPHLLPPPWLDRTQQWMLAGKSRVEQLHLVRDTAGSRSRVLDSGR